MLSSAYVYDPQADAWTKLASMGTARNPPASAAVGGKLYVFHRRGGRPQRAAQHGGGLRPCFGPLGAADELDLRTMCYGGDRFVSAVPRVFHALRLDMTEGGVPAPRF